MKHWRSILLWGGLLLALVVANHGIVRRERILSDGSIVLLELTPVDPRSMMQGDYMALRFAAVDDIRNALYPELRDGGSAKALKQMGAWGSNGCSPEGCHEGYAVFVIDRQGVGRFVRQQVAPRPTAPGEIAVRYRERDWWEIRIASNAWFFPEGQAKRYAPARYGELRVNEDGEALLTGLRDDKRKPL
jgi:uncharacterized membrane-anchored protein